MEKILLCFLLLTAIALPFSNAKVLNLKIEIDDESYKEALSETVKNVTQDICKCAPYPKPIDCEEVQKNGNTNSGVYEIWPKSRLKNCVTLKVYCDMETDGGGWTVIQRRGDFNNPEDYFNKNWHEYKNGFGKLREEFWLGNDNIFAITNQGRYSVRFEMKHRNGTSKFALYGGSPFYIEDEQRNYKLHLPRYIAGDAENALAPHHLREFYTRDKPNIPDDVKKGGRRPAGGWWYNIFPSSNLNGLNKKGNFESNDGIVWNTFGGYRNSMESTEIKVRSLNY